MSLDSIGGMFSQGGEVVGYGGAGDVATSSPGWLSQNSGGLGLFAQGLSSIASVAGGRQQQGASEYNARVDELNAMTARATAEAEAKQRDIDNKRLIGMALAAAGASGVDPNVGSPVNVLSDMSGQGELSRQLILYRGNLRAFGYEQQAALDRYSGRQAADAGILRGGTTFLTAYSRYLGNRVPTATGSA